MAFATLNDMYMMFGKENLMKDSNLESYDLTDPTQSALVEARIQYYIDLTADEIGNSLRQGAYDLEQFSPPYPQALIAYNAKLAYVGIYRAKHNQDETTNENFKSLTDECISFIDRCRGGAYRFFDKEGTTPLALPYQTSGRFKTSNSLSDIGLCNTCRRDYR